MFGLMNTLSPLLTTLWMPPSALSAERVIVSRFIPWATATVAPSPGLHAIVGAGGLGAGVTVPVPPPQLS